MEQWDIARGGDESKTCLRALKEEQQQSSLYTAGQPGRVRTKQQDLCRKQYGCHSRPNHLMNCQTLPREKQRKLELQIKIR